MKFKTKKNKGAKKEQKKPRLEIQREQVNSILKRLGYKITYHELNAVFIKIMFALMGIMFFASFFLFLGLDPGAFIFLFIFSTFIAPLLLLILSYKFTLYWGDYVLYKRRKEIEKYLPDMLQLTAANVNAGMTLERALWYAVKPSFGILAKEMEIVAKSTLTGKSIYEALTDFTEKYESDVLNRTINMILEGLRSGSRMGDLLNKISINIQEIRIMKKEMSASVTTYVIFITAAAIVIAPFLMGLSHELIVVIKKILSQFITGGDVSGSSFNINFDPNAISLHNFTVFAFTNLFFTSVISAMIISIISRGNIKDGLKSIPIYVVVSFSIFIIAYKIIGLFLGSMF